MYIGWTRYLIRREVESYKADQTEFKLPGNYTTRAAWIANVRELTGETPEEGTPDEDDDPDGF